MQNPFSSPLSNNGATYINGGAKAKEKPDHLSYFLEMILCEWEIDLYL